MKVRWTPSAASDLEQICVWIERENPDAAVRVAKTIYEACGRLTRFPYLGKKNRRHPEWRDLILSHLPFIVIYRIQGKTIEIGRIIHGARERS